MGANPAAAALAAFCFPLAGEEEGLDGGELLAARQRRRMVEYDGMQSRCKIKKHFQFYMIRTVFLSSDFKSQFENFSYFHQTKRVCS